MGTSTSPKNAGVDFVIVTALEEERDALLRQLPGFKKLPPSADFVNVYYTADVPVTFPGGSTAQYKVAVLSLINMGRVQATLATTEAIHRWRPNYVLLVGIAGGIAAKNVGVGDILVSSQVVDYELQKLTPQGPQVRWEVYRVEPRLLAATRNFDEAAWQEVLSIPRPAEGKLLRHIGPIASGDKVIAFSEVLSFYRDKWPALIGVEMEAGGAAAAAFQDGDPPGFFMVRGVSDLADETKGTPDIEKWRAYACEVAAAYAVGLLKSGPVVPLNPSPVSKPDQADVVKPTAKPAADRSIVLVVVPIPAGPFWLGSSPDDFEAPENTKPGREVYLPEYRIGRYPVTNVEYARFVAAAKYHTPEHWIDGQVPAGLEDHPVVNVDFDDASAYCHWLSETTRQSWRLPTEAEWEKAARGPLPNKQRFVWGNDWRSDACNSEEAGRGTTTPVSAFEPINCSVFDVIDMAGNVWEWVASLYEPFPGSVHTTLTHGPAYRVVRGGSYHNPGKDSRVYIRGRYKLDVKRPYLGFRIVLETVASASEPIRQSIKMVDTATARRILVEKMGEEELRDLCVDLKIDYETLQHDTKLALARELVLYCERRDRMEELKTRIQHIRPDISW
jgi:formylglycine-generating enzyme required for sulfatase activity